MEISEDLLAEVTLASGAATYRVRIPPQNHPIFREGAFRDSDEAPMKDVAREAARLAMEFVATKAEEEFHIEAIGKVGERERYQFIGFYKDGRDSPLEFSSVEAVDDEDAHFRALWSLATKDLENGISNPNTVFDAASRVEIVMARRLLTPEDVKKAMESIEELTNDLGEASPTPGGP